MRNTLIVAVLLGSASAAHAQNVPAQDASDATEASEPPKYFGGPYAGFQLGLLGDSERTHDYAATNGADLGSANAHRIDYAVGARLGYDWVSGHLLIGVLADVNSSVAMRHMAATDPAATKDTTLFGQQASLRARLGYVSGPLLVYATGGIEVGEAYHNYVYAGRSVHKTYHKFSLVPGVGAQYALSKSWSLGLEYLNFDAGSWQQPSPVNPAVKIVQTGRINSAMSSLNYRF